VKAIQMLTTEATNSILESYIESTKLLNK